MNNSYVDRSMVSKADKTELSNYIPKSGLTADLDMKNHRVVNLKTPENSSDAVISTFLSQELSKYLHETGETMKGDIDLGGNRIFNVANSSNDAPAVNKSYVDSGLNKCLPIDGSSVMQVELSLDLHPLTDLPEPKMSE